MPDRYTITFVPGGYAYTRQVLGQRPHDEVRPLIDSIEAQKAEQDAAWQPPTKDDERANALSLASSSS
jgi:hypothetical protein